MFNLNNISDERQQQQQVVIVLYFVIQILTIKKYSNGDHRHIHIYNMSTRVITYYNYNFQFPW